jgi:hypothetical protein
LSELGLIQVKPCFCDFIEKNPDKMPQTVLFTSDGLRFIAALGAVYVGFAVG